LPFFFFLLPPHFGVPYLCLETIKLSGFMSKSCLALDGKERKKKNNRISNESRPYGLPYPYADAGRRLRLFVRVVKMNSSLLFFCFCFLKWRFNAESK
jgi:hypothetical protein